MCVYVCVCVCMEANFNTFFSDLVRNKFSWKRGLCQFLNISVICHYVKNQKKIMSHS